MGGSNCKEPTDALVDRCLPIAQQRLVSKNFQLLASQATDAASSFSLEDWRSLHAAFAPLLADATFKAMTGGPTASYDSTRRAVAMACDQGHAAGLLLFDAFAGLCRHHAAAPPPDLRSLCRSTTRLISIGLA